MEPRADPPLESAARKLYGVAPEEFVETRGRLAAAARADGDRELARRLQALRRPTLSAWALNRLARQAEADLDELLTAGARLRAAWTHGGAEDGAEDGAGRSSGGPRWRAGSTLRRPAEYGRPAVATPNRIDHR